MAAKTLLYDLELINVSVMFFDKNDLYLTFKFRMVTDKKIKRFYASEL